MTHTITPRKFLTTSEVAICLGGGCNRDTVCDLIRENKLKAKKVGKGYRILPEWLDEFMSQPDEPRKKPNGIDR